MIKVCHVTTVHQPFDIRIFQKECRALVDSGFDVSLVACHSHDEVRNGVRILALSRPKSRLQRWILLTNQARARVLESGAQIVHFHDPELLPLGLRLQREGKTVIYDVHESHADSIRDRSYLPIWARQPLANHVSNLEKRADERLSAIVGATPKIAKSFSSTKCVLVQNYPFLGELQEPNSMPINERESRFVHLGGLSEIRGGREMVLALEQVPEVRLVLVGDITPSSFREELQRLPGWNQVEHLGWQDRLGVSRALSSCVAGLILFHPLRNHIESQPNKMFEYMSAGLPVLCSNFPYWQEIIDQCKCGRTCNPLAVNEIASAMKDMLSDKIKLEQMGIRGLEAVRSSYNWESERPKLIQLYQHLSKSLGEKETRTKS